MNAMDTAQLDMRARTILTDNDRGGYTVPTAGLYPYQWNWDSAFAALGFASFDRDRAWRELETLMAGQWDDGMVPHIQFHVPDPGYFPGPDIWQGRGPVPSSGITQPPVAATVVRRLFDRDPVAGRDRAAALYPKLLAWHRWFMDWRCDRGRVFVTHPWEAGRDNAPDWDSAMAAIDPAGVMDYHRRDTDHVDASMRPTRADYDRYVWLLQYGRDTGWDPARIAAKGPFRVADPGQQFILLRAMRDLAALGTALGEETAGVAGWITALEAGAAALWNPDLAAFDACDLTTGVRAGALTNASFLCWYAGIDRSEMRAHLARICDALPFCLPSLDPADPRYEPKRYWRGPVWAVMNLMAGNGMAEMGLTAAAETLRTRTADLIAEHGFAEYFDPETGAPAGGAHFTWTAAVWLAWASPSAKG
jgi:hypothetical protein